MAPIRQQLEHLKFHIGLRVRLLAWLGSALFMAGLFVKITWELHEDPVLNYLDEQILILIGLLRSGALTIWAVDMTALGSPTVLTVVTLIGLAVLTLNRDRSGFLYLTTGAIGAAVGTALLKGIFTRPRPTVIPQLVEVSGFSYPSGHSFASTSIYLILMFLAWRYYPSWRDRSVLAIVTIVVICGVAASRLYLGVHYPSDVLSGVLLGGAWASLLGAVFLKRRFYRPALETRSE